MATTRSDYEFLQPTISESDSLMVTLFFATVFHIFILLGISFAIPKPDKTNKQIEVTLSSTPSKAPKNAKLLAKDNQLGAGTEEIKPFPNKRQLASQGGDINKPPGQTEARFESRPKALQKLITQKDSEQKINTAEKQASVVEIMKKKITKESLRKQISQLGEEIRNFEKSSEKTRIKAVNSVSTHKYIAAQYVKDWERKVTRVGLLNPSKIPRTGSVRIDVAINADGSIYSIKSAGATALDADAKRIVKMSAPFSALPKKLLEELDILLISRTWFFTDKGIVSDQK